MNVEDNIKKCLDHWNTITELTSKLTTRKKHWGWWLL